LADLALRARVVLAPDCRSVGVSVWGDVQAGGLGLSLKKLLKQKDWTIRAVLPKEGNVLTSAVVGGQRLATQPHGPEANGLELVAIAHEGKWQMGVTLTTNNIDFYSARDFDIPAPDPVSGMLPPKLAQMMINVAVGDTKAHVHDPFCGNGRIVLEAALMGLPATGSDIEPGKVAASQQNLAWLGEVAHFVTKSDQVWQGDATAAGNRDKILTKVGSQYVLVGEPYLGKPLRTPLKTSEKQAWLNDVTPQYLHYFETWTTATTQPLCHLLVIPRAKVENNTEVAVLDAIVDRLHQIGYSTEVLFCYDRPDSIVRRDIVRITKSQ
jgi:16S rRNA G966 N2-methylase RsmD